MPENLGKNHLAFGIKSKKRGTNLRYIIYKSMRFGKFINADFIYYVYYTPKKGER